MYTFVNLVTKCLETYKNNKTNLKGIVSFYKAYTFASVLLELHDKHKTNDKEIEKINKNWKYVCYDAFAEHDFKNTFDLSSELNVKFNKFIISHNKVIIKFLEEFKESSVIPEWWTKGKGIDIKSYSDTLASEDITKRERIESQ